MTDLDLDKLARRRPPAPDAEARARAFASAMQAFDDAEKNATAPQGSAGDGRRSSMFNRIWSPIMNRRLLAGSALATLLVVPVAGLVTYEMVRNGTVPLTTETGRREAEMITAFEQIPATTDRVIFFPRAAGGAA